MRPHRVFALALLVTSVIGEAAFAMPGAPDVFCAAYPTAPTCLGGTVNCATCHTTPPSFNAYGAQVAATLLPEEPRPLLREVMLEALPLALASVEPLDADGDTHSNIDEIVLGSLPADDASVPGSIACGDGRLPEGYDVCAYDPVYTYTKVLLDFCGASPTRAQRQALMASASPRDDLHAALARCLDSEYWLGRDGVLWRLAHRKIKPLRSIKSGQDAGDIPLADYTDDYAFFAFTQTDGRDAREVLTGQYLARIIDGPPTRYESYQATALQELAAKGRTAAQLVDRDKRAGLLTHRWFIMSNTMFTAIPRTTAAQAYRAFLGYDLSRLEGLFPVANEPVDYDAKSVDAAACAMCHATLDPLTYPFTRYEGLGGDKALRYNAARLQAFVDTDGPLVASTPERGWLFGQPVQDLVEWAQVAADSDAFARATVLDYWRLLFGEDPRPSEAPQFAALWAAFKTEHAYSVEAMLHALIDTEAYGVP